MRTKFYLFTALLLFAGHSATAQHFNSPIALNSTGHSGTGANIDVVYYRCDWTIDPSVSKNIAGTVTTYFKTTAANVSIITFDLNKSSFNNASLIVTYHGINCVRSFPASGAVDTLTVNLPSTIASIGTLDSVSIAYSGTPPAVYGQEEGFQRGELPAGSGNWYIYTLSESYEDRDWWPCKADMQDKADSLDINVTVPNTYWVAANGKLVDSAINGASRTFKYKHRYPIATYLVGLGIAKYNRQHRGTVNIAGKDVPVVYYTYPNMTGSTLTTAIARMDVSRLELVEFSNKYGPYPFADEKHGYYQHNWGGGIEHQTFSGMSGGSMASWSVIAHELAHQWFGNKVTFSTWSHLWLAEGFAKYSEALAAELIPAIGVTAASHLSGIKSTARATNTTPVLLSAASIQNSNTIWTANNDNAIYQRGAMIVSMLRAMLGDARFFQGCRDYLNDPLLSYKSATTADLQRNMENQLFGVDLTPFFNAWVNGTGRTDYTGNYYISGKSIQFRLTQTRNPAGNPFMPMPVVIKIANSGGTIDTSVVIYHHSPTQLAYAGTWEGIGTIGQDFITYNLSFIPATITVDPDNKTMATGTLTSVGSPLNATVLNFSAAKTTFGNQLSLVLNANEPIDKVVLMKSGNGIDFSEAGLMNRVGSQQNNFGFTDVLPYSPVSFYQAKIFAGGTVYYSPVVKVQERSKNSISISPNPASDVINVNFTNTAGREKVIIRVINPAGKVVIESATNNNFIHYDISNLPTGVYFVQALQNGQIFAAGKFIVAR
ncbi:MAG TPA: M1 family aminopeptidase [Ferruginibacter sp.]|nr:M1 family aminopeptidase [Ferruginibacter sp.]